MGKQIDLLGMAERARQEEVKRKAAAAKRKVEAAERPAGTPISDLVPGMNARAVWEFTVERTMGLRAYITWVQEHAEATYRSFMTLEATCARLAEEGKAEEFKSARTQYLRFFGEILELYYNTQAKWEPRSWTCPGHGFREAYIVMKAADLKDVDHGPNPLVFLVREMPMVLAARDEQQADIGTVKDAIPGSEVFTV